MDSAREAVAPSRADVAYEALERRLRARARADAEEVRRARVSAGELAEGVARWRSPRLVALARTACARAIEAACAVSGTRVNARVVAQLERRDADASCAGLGTRGAIAIAAGVTENDVTESLNVSRNRIDDDGVAALCEAATRAARLRSLNFSDNSVSIAIAETCAKAMKRVKVLNFSACGVDDACAKALFAMLCGEDYALETLSLSKNRLTCGQAIGDALEANGALRELDVSWNALDASACAHIARGLKRNEKLEYLSLAWNGIGDEGGKYIGDSLRTNRSIIELDMSRCRLGCDACMVISEGLRTNDSLTTLRLDHNACGEDGGRHLMHMLLANDCITTLTLEGSSFVDAQPLKKKTTPSKKSVAMFNPQNPDGRHSLNLDDSGDRAIASQLWHQDRENPGSMKSARMLSASKREKEAVDVLEKFRSDGLDGISLGGGVLEIQFVTSSARSARRPVVIDTEDFENILRQLRNNRLSDFERLSRLRMFCRSYYFHAEHAAKLLETFILEGDDRLQAASACFARLLDAENAEMMFKSRSEFDRLAKMIGSYRHFRAANPTGRYALNLAVPIDRTIASTMMDIATFEGRRRTWRNASFNRVRSSDLMPSGVPERIMRRMPAVGMLEFDYTSNIRVPENASIMGDGDLHEFLHTRGVLSTRTDEWTAEESVSALHSLREASVHVNISSIQYARVFTAFPQGADRVEASVILFNRVVDSANIPALVVHQMSCFEQCVFGARLGWRNVLGESLQAFTVHYRLDLNCQEQASVAKHLVCCAVREYSDVQVIRNVTINGRRLARDPVEDATLWSVLTAESFTPTLEFDYFGADVWDVVRRELSVHVVPDEKPEREAILKRLATRLAFVRAAALHGVWVERNSRVIAPNVWQKAWSDVLDEIVRSEIAHTAISPLRVIFNALDNDASGSLSVEEFALGVAALGRPIPRTILSAFVSSENFDDRRSENVVTFEHFERICSQVLFPERSDR